MNIDDKKKITAFYEDVYAKYGTDARSVHWADEHNQLVRFETLSKIANLSGKSVLDVGCGLGDLYKYFVSHSIPVDYSGIDIVPTFIDRARERFPDGRFLCGDAETLNTEYDYVLASGVLSFVIPNDKEHYFAMIKKMFDHAKEGLAFNMLNETAHPSDDTYLSYNIDEVAKYCKTLSPRVVVVSDYLPWDFTVYMYKE
ncbi:MAG: class I SAM-dependent methyltransferase [Candidatus Paceibacterota bacterium]|jgi:ubiquinone/menaquinone biosynthesis C-methylase UbiE